MNLHQHSEHDAVLKPLVLDPCALAADHTHDEDGGHHHDGRNRDHGGDHHGDSTHDKTDEHDRHHDSSHGH